MQYDGFMRGFAVGVFFVYPNIYCNKTVFLILIQIGLWGSRE